MTSLQVSCSKSALLCALLVGLAAPGYAQSQPESQTQAPVEGLDPEGGLVGEPGATDEPATDEPAPAVDAEASFDSSEVAAETDGSGDKPGLWLLGGKIGGIASFNGLDPFVHGAIELGYVFPALDQGLGALLQVEYSTPGSDGHVDEDFDPERVPGGGYDWELLQKELVLAPTFLYRMTFVSESITPYAGIGPRVYLLETVVSGKAEDEVIDETTERSTKWGIGVPVGAEFALGPGGLTAELLFQWGPFEHTLTGDTHLGGLSLFVGYRLLL